MSRSKSPNHNILGSEPPRHASSKEAARCKGDADRQLAARSVLRRWVVYVGLFPTALGFNTWAYALMHTTAGRLGSTTHLVPAVAVVLGWLVLGETPPALALGGGVLAIGAVVIAHWTPARRRRALAPGDAS